MEHATASHHAAHADFLNSVFSPSANSSDTRIQRVSSKASDVSRLSARQTLDTGVSTPASTTANDRNVASASPARTSRFSWKRLRLTPQQQKEGSCWTSLFTAGWSDATAGVLIPAMQKYYSIGYMTVATLFVGQCVGFLSASVVTTYLADRYGLGKTMFIGACIQMIGYAVISSAPPFPVIPCVYGISGFGMALQDAAANGYVVGLPNATHKLGILHGIYGLGALFSPLVGTAFVDAGIRFSLFYLVSFGICLFSALCIAAAFRFKPDDPEPDVAGEIELAEMNADASGSSTPRSMQAAARPPITTEQKLREISRSRLVWLCCIFITLYVGAEVTIGGWTVTFLQQERDGGTRAGFVASGFWGGITLGRIALPAFNLFIGEKNVIFIYLALAIGLELIVWLVPNLVGDAVAVSLVGFFMGPFYPNALSLGTKLLPRYLHTSFSGFVAAFGQSGAAVFPFLAGILAQSKGVWTLQPVLIAIFVAIGLVWLPVPKPSRKDA